MESKSIAQEIMALRALPLPDLVARYKQVFGKEPAFTSRELLWKEIAWKLQADRATLPPESAKASIEKLVGDVTFRIAKKKPNEPPAPASRRRKPDELPIGTIIVRKWRGKDVRLQVVESGYEVEGVVYETLSAAAHAVTGAHWNGKLFFGLTSRRRTK